MVNPTLKCESVQEQVAWGRDLDNDIQDHVLVCIECGRLALEYAELDSRLSPVLGNTNVPAGFAARVMKGLPAEAKTSRSTQPAWWPIFKLGLASAGVALASLAFAPSAGGAIRLNGDPSYAAFQASGWSKQVSVR